MLLHKLWESLLNICKKVCSFICKLLPNTCERIKSFIKNTNIFILILPIINILVYIIPNFINKSQTICKYLAIGFLICVFIYNLYIVAENKEYFKYKVGNSLLRELWLLLCNLSRFFVNFAILFLLIPILSGLLNSVILWWFGYSDVQGITYALESLLIVVFAFALVLHLVNFFTEGLITGFRTISAMFVLFLAGFSDIMTFFLGSAGAKLIIDWLFSDNYIEYIKLKMKDDERIKKKKKIKKIKKKLDSIRIKFTADFNFVMFALNLSMIIRKIVSPELKSLILYCMKWLSYRGGESVQDTPIVDRFLIGLLTVAVSVIWYSLLKYLFGKYLGNKILGKKSN